MNRTAFAAYRVLFRLALVPAPAGFRRTYAARMFDVLTDTVTEAYERNGWIGAALCAVGCCSDALEASVAERFEMIARDLSYALRVLAKVPLFSAIVVATLALTIGATTAVFSVVDGVLLHPLPYPQADRLVNVYESTQIGTRTCTYCTFSLPNLRDVRARSRTLSDIAAYQDDSVTLSGAGRAVSLGAVDVDEHFFATLGVQPVIGRFFSRRDTERNAAPVIAFGERFWHDRFHGDPSVIGRLVRIDGIPTRIVGVVPATFVPPLTPYANHRFDAYLPIVDDAQNSQRGNHSYKAIARLRPGSGIEAARADVARIAADLLRAYPADEYRRSLVVRSLRETLFGDVTPALGLVGAGVVLLLLVACANVANLLLARAATRRYELTVRAAVGASTGRIIALLLAETFVLAVAGGALAIVLAIFATHAFVAARPPGIPRLAEVHVDAASFTFTLGIVVVVTVLAGLTPALSVAGKELSERLNARGRSGTDRGGDALRNTFVVFQTGFALALAVASGLVLQSLSRLSHVDPGFQPRGVAIAATTLASGDFESRPAPDPTILAEIARVHRGLAVLPGVRAASVSLIVPFSGRESSTDFQISGQKHGAKIDADYNVVSPGYFTTFGIPLLKGRYFNADDAANGRRVAIVSRTFAQRFLGSQALGRTLLAGMNDPSFVGRTIVGVVGDVRSQSLVTPPQPLMYFPLTQIPFDASLWIAVKSPLAPTDLRAAVDPVWSALDPNLAPLAFDPMESYLAAETARSRLLAVMLSGIAGLALLLAAAGIYSIVSYGVARCTHDIGIRMALGAKPLALVRTIVVRSVALALVGVAAGLALVGAFGGTLEALLYEIAPTDPTTLAFVALVLLAVAFVASLLPAWRATRIDPLVALRYE